LRGRRDRDAVADREGVKSAHVAMLVKLFAMTSQQQQQQQQHQQQQRQQQQHIDSGNSCWLIYAATFA